MLIQCGCRSESECFYWKAAAVIASLGALSVEVLILSALLFSSTLVLLGAQSLNLFFSFFLFLSVKHFYLVYLGDGGGKKKCLASSSAGLISCRSAWKLSPPWFIGFSCHFDFGGVQSVFPRSMLEMRFNTE